MSSRGGLKVTLTASYQTAFQASDGPPSRLYSIIAVGADVAYKVTYARTQSVTESGTTTTNEESTIDTGVVPDGFELPIGFHPSVRNGKIVKVEVKNNDGATAGYAYCNNVIRGG